MSSEPRRLGLDDLWDALWEDLRHNASGKPSGDAIIVNWRAVCLCPGDGSDPDCNWQPSAAAVLGLLTDGAEPPEHVDG